MIIYKLKCDINHTFECWFQNSESFDIQKKKNLLSCPFCASSIISKAPMAPRLAFQKSEKSENYISELPSHASQITAGTSSTLASEVYNTQNDLTGAIHMAKDGDKTSLFSSAEITLPISEETTTAHPATLVRKALLDLKALVKQHCDDVGGRFTEEARRMHYGETKKRNIYGQASLEEIIELHQEGVEVSALPPFPREDA